MKNNKYRVILISTIFGLGVWFLDAIVDYLFFYESGFWELLLFDIPPREIYTRCLILIAFIVFGILLSFSTFIRDIANRKKADRALRDSEERYKTIFSQAVDTIVLIEPETGAMLEFNDKAHQNLGYTREEFAKLKISDFEIIESKEDVITHMDKILQRGSDVFETKHRRKDGQVRDILVKASVVSIGRKHFIQSMWIDITERKKAEQILKKYRTSLEKMVSKRTEELLRTRKQLEDAKRLSDIGTLAATIAHELRNPLGVIKVAAYNIKRKSKGAASFKIHLSNIDKKISESDQIIKNLLSYSRIKMPKYENVSCKKALAEILIAVKRKYAKWGVTIKRTCNCDKDDLIEADPVHITELYFNIMDNAFQSFANKRGVIEIEGKYNKKENSFTEIFKDNGMGIDEEDLSKVFEPFFTRKSKGIGLGLTVCKQLAGLHNGTIEIQSKKGKGTTVTLTLPLKRK